MLVGRLSSLLVCAVLVAGGQVSLRGQPFLAARRSAPIYPAARMVALGWKPSPDPGVAGYFLCWGHASGRCTNLLDAGNVTNIFVGGLSRGVSYWFTVVAYDGAGRESVPSNEIKWQPLGLARPAAHVKVDPGVGQSATGAVAQVSFQALASPMYEVQATTDFLHWETVLMTNSPVTGMALLQRQDIPHYPRRFYRLRELPAGSLPALQP